MTVESLFSEKARRAARICYPSGYGETLADGDGLCTCPRCIVSVVPPCRPYPAPAGRCFIRRCRKSEDKTWCHSRSRRLWQAFKLQCCMLACEASCLPNLPLHLVFQLWMFLLCLCPPPLWGVLKRFTIKYEQHCILQLRCVFPKLL